MHLLFSPAILSVLLKTRRPLQVLLGLQVLGTNITHRAPPVTDRANPVAGPPQVASSRPRACSGSSRSRPADAGDRWGARDRDGDEVSWVSVGVVFGWGGVKGVGFGGLCEGSMLAGRCSLVLVHETYTVCWAFEQPDSVE